MRSFAVTLLVCACSSPASPPVERADPVVVDETTHDAAPEPVAVVTPDAAPADESTDHSPLDDLPPSGEEALPADATAAQIDARYALAVQHASNEPQKALALLLDIANAVGGDALDRARWDDAWKAQWDQVVFQDIVGIQAEAVVDDSAQDEEVDESESPKLVCPKGAKRKGKWSSWDGEIWCEKGGKKHGPYLFREEGYDMSEGVQGSSGEYVNGKKQGLWQWYASFSGSSYGAYVADLEHGLWLVEERESWSYEVYDHGKRQGVQRKYSNDGDRPIGIATYDQGELHGTYVEHDEYEPWGLRDEGTYARGKRIGEWRMYGDAGELRVVEHWDAGVRDGEFVYYDETGQVIARTTIDHDTGDWIAYSPYGILLQRGRVDNGVKIGAWGERDPSAQSRWDEGTYTNGKRTGTWTIYEDLGGAKHSRGEFTNGKQTGEWTYWHSNGTVLSHGKIVDGKPHGTWKIYAEDGTLEQTLVLDKGKLVKLDGHAATKKEKEAFYPDSFAEEPHKVEVYDDPEW